MNSIDDANELLFKTLTMLADFQNQEDINFQQKEDIMNIIDNLEEVRSLLYDLKNELRATIS